jgi:alginate O-acetyltransferase complex protein AlgI
VSVTSLAFLAFAFLAALLHASWGNLHWRAGVFLVANLLFVASFTTSPLALLPFGLFLAWGYLAVRAVPFVRPPLHATVFILGTLIIFCWLKKYWFLSALPYLPFAYLTIGLSYSFFRIMGMIIDARNDPAIARVGPVAYFNFAMNFPTMIAGPIDRYQNFYRPAEPITAPMVGRGLERIALGFFKVMVLSALFSSWQALGTHNLLDGSAQGQRILWSLVSFGVYPIYLYWNFSGYTDIVLGIGNLFGKQYPENFNIPFSSFNFLEYWSRWHMSLSNWLRDYVYTPFVMAMMRRNRSKRLDPYLGVIGYFVTFFLIGIWHGSTIIFAIYGLLLALGVSVNKLYQIYLPQLIGKKQYKSLASRLIYKFFARGLTCTWTSFCLICFWASNEQALSIVRALGPAAMAISFVALFLVATVLVNLWEELFAAVRRLTGAAPSSGFGAYARAVALGCLLFGCLAYVMVTHQVNSDVIYQAF